MKYPRLLHGGEYRAGRGRDERNPSRIRGGAGGLPRHVTRWPTDISAGGVVVGSIAERRPLCAAIWWPANSKAAIPTTTMPTQSANRPAPIRIAFSRLVALKCSRPSRSQFHCSLIWKTIQQRRVRRQAWLPLASHARACYRLDLESAGMAENWLWKVQKTARGDPSHRNLAMRGAVSNHFSLSIAHTPGSANCWKILSICSGRNGISAATHHLSKVSKAPARY